MIELAERCEKASGPDRELDCLILEALGYEVKRDHARPGQVVRGFGLLRYIGGTHWCTFNRYTASLDAAMTLIPKGWRLWTGDFSVEGRFNWMLKGPLAPWTDPEDGRETIAPQYGNGIGSTPALALCAAALRARAQGQPS
jgi:hypothetical protein